MAVSALAQRRSKASATRSASKSSVALSSRAAQAASAKSSASSSGAAKVSSADQIAAEIVRGLYDGKYVAGQKLIESDLTRRFGVGRGTVREALKRLAAEGLVTVSLHKGASIRALARQDVQDMLDVVEALCGLTARRSAERLTREDEKALRAIMTSLTALAATSDSFEFVRMRDRFYHLLAQVSHNRELLRLLSMVNVHLIRAQFRSAYGLSSQKGRLDDYQKIVDAIIARDAARAERTMRQHIRNTAIAIDQLPDREFDN